MTERQNVKHMKTSKGMRGETSRGGEQYTLSPEALRRSSLHSSVHPLRHRSCKSHVISSALRVSPRVNAWMRGEGRG